MPSHPRGTASQQCAALASGVGFVSRSTAAERASGTTLLLVHPAAGCGLPQRQHPRRGHVRSRPRGVTSSFLTFTNRSTMNRPRHCPRDGSGGVDGGGAWGGVCGALRTAASPTTTTTADVFDAAAATGVERLGEEGEQRERISAGGSAAVVSEGVGESPAGVSAGSPTKDANMQNSGTRINERSQRSLPPPGTPARLVVEAKKSASAAAAFMRRMTEAGKRGRWVNQTSTIAGQVHVVHVATAAVCLPQEAAVTSHRVQDGDVQQSHSNTHTTVRATAVGSSCKQQHAKLSRYSSSPLPSSLRYEVVCPTSQNRLNVFPVLRSCGCTLVSPPSCEGLRTCESRCVSVLNPYDSIR